ncbi:CRTAC1 family protein [Shewanella electrodiphila]|uniref:CRTAC1 family protein n=1 Tax=Shewanella electrodiphila TaxID=934143 RepID=A0ABT0KQS0_9GAMM|nr:CRTAC1 family protein [Shewanella electrodiphila]MCL1046014.1 CRTAC1 family protein [Shewanella electrodiphila]
MNNRRLTQHRNGISIVGLICMMAFNNHYVLAATPPTPMFNKVTQESRLSSFPAWKYGGPVTVDLNRDGNYDLLLTNHDQWPTQLFYGSNKGAFTSGPHLLAQADVHGISAADYDNDGEVDVIITLGGGNGTQPKPPRLFKQQRGKFVDVTVQSGLANMGARGRSARWLDVDNDGDLDLIQINAEKMITEDVPRNLLFINQGDGKFKYHSSPLFEDIDAEKILISQLNDDQYPDLITFNAYSALQIWLGKINGQYENATKQYLPAHLQDVGFVTAIAQTDIENDGDTDLYLARGKSYYQIANNALSFDKKTTRLDIRDEGNKSQDGISFTSQGPIKLGDFYHFPRGPKLIKLPVFIGQHHARIDPPKRSITLTPELAKGKPTITESGWYIHYVGQIQQGENKGQHQWRLDWKLNDNLAWDIRASITGVTSIQPDWQPQALGVDDILLVNDNGRFVDASSRLPPQSKHNNWGVISADFDNNTYSDFFVYRFGELNKRVEDILLLNHQGQFTQVEGHGATALGSQAHGDMGTAFDIDKDGFVDIISGDDDNGQWQVFNNLGGVAQAASKANFIIVNVGYSASGIDPLGAKVVIEYHQKSATQAKGKIDKQVFTVGSISAAHSQSLMNIAHFGLGEANQVKTITVTWRDNSQLQQHDVAASQWISMGN